MISKPDHSTIHYTELPEGSPRDFFFAEWNTYRREIARLLAEGGEGKFGLFRGDVLHGLFDSWQAARKAGFQEFGLDPFMVKEIREFEPLYRIPSYAPDLVRSPRFVPQGGRVMIAGHEYPTIHYSQLPEAEPEGALFEEWNTYRKNAAQWLAEGHEGKFALLKGSKLVGFFETSAAAQKEGFALFFPEPFMAHQVQEFEPLHRALWAR